MNRKGFTLIEVLLVLAVMALLAALLLPAFATSRNLARRSACSSRLRQVGLATAMYQQDYEQLPLHLSLITPTYLSDPRLLICPNDPAIGQRAGNDYLEGNFYLPSGVSYQYYPQWQTAQDLSWYAAPPAFGRGQWEDLTPLAGCVWHWARTFSTSQAANTPNSRGWQLILTLGGSVRRVRVEDPIAEFDPGKYY